MVLVPTPMILLECMLFLRIESQDINFVTRKGLSSL